MVSACERVKLGQTQIRPVFMCPCERGIIAPNRQMGASTSLAEMVDYSGAKCET